MPVISLSVTPLLVSEIGTTNIEFTFSRTGSTSTALTVNLESSGTLNTSDFSQNLPVAFSNSPAKIWTNLFGSSDYGVWSELAVATDGSVYFYGQYGTSPTNSGDFLAKLKPDGTNLWTKSIGDANGGGFGDLAIASDGYVYVAGTLAANTALFKYSPDGALIWTRSLATQISSETTLINGADGSIYVAGLVSGSVDGQEFTGRSDAFITKYSSEGVKTWTKLLGTNSMDVGVSLATGVDGSIF